MDEKKETKEVKKEGEDKQTPEGTGEGDKYETTPIIERAREEREKLEAAVKAQREENDRTEKIMARKALGGESPAGDKPESKEESPHEYRVRINKEMAEGKTEFGN